MLCTAMTVAFFITHPEVVVNRSCPVPRWHLADAGIVRMRTFALDSALHNLGAVWSSDETKAIEAAGVLAARFGLPVHVSAPLRENDRSAAGFLPPDDFENTADAFFANPTISVRGWETAADAQQRVVRAFVAIVSAHSGGDVAIVAHGAVGTLLLCHLLNVPIDRKYDQPSQGHYWALNLEANSVIHRWQSIAGDLYTPAVKCRRSPASALSPPQQVGSRRVQHFVAASTHHRPQHPQAEPLDLLQPDRRRHRQLLLGGDNIQHRRTVMVQHFADRPREFARILGPNSWMPIARAIAVKSGLRSSTPDSTKPDAFIPLPRSPEHRC